MDLKFTEEHEMMRKMVRDFAEKDVAPLAAELDEKGEVPFDNIKTMGRLGLLGLTAPEEYGGCGADTHSYVIAIEELTNEFCTAITIAVLAQALDNSSMAIT
ncbi:MAG: acyl-CoA dehydrogenase family protein [Cyanobacteriota bacterium]|nr:acyl-CoA dehydrogenase family protein [Cyanobacteriota bacterium]